MAQGLSTLRWISYMAAISVFLSIVIATLGEAVVLIINNV